MDKSTMNNFLWITVTVIVALSLIALASPFGVYIRNNIETFTGDYIEKGDQSSDDNETPVCELIINYEVPADAGTTLPSVHKTLKKNEQYSVVSPTIYGYQPNMEVVSGVITKDPTEITVTYSYGKYSIKYVLNEGQWATSYVPPATYTYKTATSLPTASNITKEHYIFDGWYETKDFSTPKVTSVGTNDWGDKVYYAKWKPEEYTITYVLNDTAEEKAIWGNSVATNGVLNSEYKTYLYGSMIKLPTELNRVGFTFDGWTEDPQGQDASKDRTQITPTDSGNKTVYAKWKRNVYEIRYHLNFKRPTGEDAKFVMLDKQYTVITVDGRRETREGIPTHYTYGETIILPASLYFPGYQGNSSNEVWYNAPTTQIVISNGVISYLPSGTIQKTQISPSIPGFIKGDNTQHSYDYCEMDLYVKPIPNTYYIKFDPNSPSSTAKVTGTMTLQSVYYDEAASLKANAFACSGYRFVGWNTSPDGSGTAYIMKNGAIKQVNDIGDGEKIWNMTTEHLDTVTLYAQWEPTNASIRFEYYYENVAGTGYELMSQGTYSGVADETVSTGVFIRARESAGFTLNRVVTVGTNISEQTMTGPDYKTTILADSSRVIKVYYNRNSYKLTFIVDDTSTIQNAKVTVGSTPYTIKGTSSPNYDYVEIVVKYGQSLSFIDTHIATHKLKEYRSNDGAYQSVTSPYNITMPANDLTITMYSIENAGVAYFDPNCTGAPAPNPSYVQRVYYTFNAEFGSLPSIDRSHFEFIGWFTEKVGGTQISVNDIFTTSSNGKTYYAHWEPLGIEDPDHECEEETVKEPTCLTTGTVRLTCVVCGASKDETIPALGHIEGTPYITVSPLCYREEKAAVDCIREENGCGNQRIREYGTGKFGPHNSNDAGQCCYTHTLAWDGGYGCTGNKEAHMWGGGRDCLCGRDGVCNVKANKDMWCKAHGTKARHTFHCGRFGWQDVGKNGNAKKGIPGRVSGTTYVGKVTWYDCTTCTKQ